MQIHTCRGAGVGWREEEEAEAEEEVDAEDGQEDDTEEAEAEQIQELVGARSQIPPLPWSPPSCRTPRG